MTYDIGRRSSNQYYDRISASINRAHNVVSPNERYTRAYNKNRRQDKRNNPYYVNYRGANEKRSNVGCGRALTRNRNLREDFDIVPKIEIEEKKKAFSPWIIVAVLIIVASCFVLIKSVSDVYETERRISSLENEISDLRTESAELSIELNQKNDLRLIEELATKKYGMVKEDALQRKYVSLSEGESIEVLEVEEEENGGVLLSSVFSSIGKFFSGD